MGLLFSKDQNITAIRSNHNVHLFPFVFHKNEVYNNFSLKTPHTLVQAILTFPFHFPHSIPIIKKAMHPSPNSSLRSSVTERRICQFVFGVI